MNRLWKWWMVRVRKAHPEAVALYTLLRRRLQGERGQFGNKGVPGVRIATASVNPGALAATTAVDVDTGIAADAADTIIGVAAPTREARLILDGSFVTGGTVRVRYKNQSAAAAAGGALTDTFIIIEG